MEHNLKLFSLDTTKCTRCGACAAVCPMGVIGISADGFPEPMSRAYRLCINCGYCVDICVPDALNHKIRKHSASSEAAAKRYEILRKKRRGESNEK